MLAELTGLRAALASELLTVRHGVTRFRITLVCLEARHRAGSFRSAFYRRCCRFVGNRGGKRVANRLTWMMN